MTIAERVKEMVGITPTYTDEQRAEVTADAMEVAANVPWFREILEHHHMIEAAFARVKSQISSVSRQAAQMDLALLLTAHSIAEENAIYPFVSLKDSSARATHLYQEQSLAKVEMAALDEIADKLSEEYDTKLEEIRLAVVHHMIEEERDIFPALLEKLVPADTARISDKYDEEFNRYAPDELADAAE